MVTESESSAKMTQTIELPQGSVILEENPVVHVVLCGRREEFCFYCFRPSATV